VLVSGVVRLYADALQRLWRGDADECEQVLSHALQAREARRRLKREAEVAVMGGEVGQAAWTGAKASSLHKAFEELQVAEAIVAGDDVAVSTGVPKHSEEKGGGSKRGCKRQEDGGRKASEKDRRRDTSPHPLRATPASEQESKKQAKSKRPSKKSSLPEEKKEEAAGGVRAAEDSEEA